MRIEQLQRYFKYLQLYLRHGTFKRWLNLIKIEIHLLNNNSDLKKLTPYFLIVDISNACNLKCPLCQTGQGKTIHRENRMDMQSYKKLLDPMIENLFQILMFNWGEPFLNKNIYDMISYNTSHNTSTVISSNLNIPIDAERLVASGLGHLIVSGDGVSQEIYEKYRVGGDLDKVFENIKNIVEAKKKAKSKTPHIEWQCLVTKYNESSLKEIKKTAKKIGADSVRFANINFYSFKDRDTLQKKWLPKNSKYQSFANDNSSKRKKQTRKPCFWLWRTAIVNPDGGLMPCCLYDIQDWGNALDTSFAEVWNNDNFKEARERSLKNHSKNKNLICDKCEADFIWK